jgi:hypothetical protein
MPHAARSDAQYAARKRVVVLATAMVALALALGAPGVAWGADLNASPSNLATVYASAQGGDVIHLAAGSYGTFRAGSKSSTVTVVASSGVTASMSLDLSPADHLRIDGVRVTGATLSGAHDVAIVNSTFTQSTTVLASVNNANILFDRDVFDAISMCSTCYEGRLTVRGYDNSAPVGVKITNSHFGNGGEADGVQIIGGANGVQVGPGNEFSGLREGNFTAHVDPVQLYGSKNTLITANYFHDNSTAVMAGDGGSGEQVVGNVFVMDEYPWAVVASHIPNMLLRHNTVIGGSLHVDDSINPQSSSTPSSGSVIDNAASVTVGQKGSLTVDYNLASDAGGAHSVKANPQFTGGSSPSTWQGFALKSGSPGTGAGSDAADMGATTFGGSSTAPPPPPPVDTTAPDTTITSGPNATTTNDSTPTFAFTSSEANSVFECRVDSGAWANCASPWTTPTLSDGAHSVAVRATDVAGNTDASPATRSFTVDTTPPVDTTAPDTTITSGPSATTSATSASFAFTATESGSTFECKLDSGAYGPCTSPRAYSALTSGSHTFSVRATDAAGNTDASPASQAWTIQSAPVDHQPVAAFTYSPASPTVGQAVSFDASSATCDDTPCTYDWVDDGDDGSGGNQWPLGNGKTLSFTFQQAGVKNVRVTVTDADGDTATMVTSITVGATAPPADTTRPDTTITSGPNGASTNDNTATFAFTSTEAGSTFACRVDAGAWASCTSPWMTPALGDGAHSVAVRATDAAGNTDASPATRSFTVDTLAPNTRIDSAPPPLSPGSSATLTFSASEAGATYECRLDAAAWAACTSPKTYTGLTLAQHTVDVRAIDAAGNVDAGPATASWTSVPVPGIPWGPDTSGDPTSGNQAPTVALAAPTAGSTFSSTLRMAATAIDDHGVSRVEFWLDGTRVARDSSAPYATTYTANRATSYGVHTVSVRAFDAAGRASSAAVTVTRVRMAAGPRRAATAASGGARAASVSDARQTTLVPVSMWRIASAPAGGSGTLVRGRGTPRGSATVSLTRCSDSSGAIDALLQLNAGEDGTMFVRVPTDGSCVLRVKPFGDA